MSKIDFEKERKILDRQITFFHFKQARKKVYKCIKQAELSQEKFFLNYFLAQKFILKENFRKALDCIDKALVFRDSDGCSYNDKALCFAELGEYMKSLECFNEGIRRERDCPSLYHNKGWLLNILNRHTEAVICFNKALELDPLRPESLYSLADSYSCLKNPLKAHKYFKKALFAVRGKSSYVYKDILRRLKFF